MLFRSWIKSSDFDCPENIITHKLIKKAVERDFLVGKGESIQPRGNAARSLSQYFPLVSLKGGEMCSEQTTGFDLKRIRGICISPLGDLILCKNFVLGRATPRTITEILDHFSYNQQPDLERLQSEGIQGLA